jgi:hypothetical protein
MFDCPMLLKIGGALLIGSANWSLFKPIVFPMTTLNPNSFNKAISGFQVVICVFSGCCQNSYGISFCKLMV